MLIIPGAPFKKFASKREEWALQNRYISPGMYLVTDIAISQICFLAIKVNFFQIIFFQAQSSLQDQWLISLTTPYYWSLEFKSSYIVEAPFCNTPHRISFDLNVGRNSIIFL